MRWFGMDLADFNSLDRDLPIERRDALELATMYRIHGQRELADGCLLIARWMTGDGSCDDLDLGGEA